MNSENRTTITDLSVDVLKYNIFYHLDVKDLMRLRRVCRLFSGVLLFDALEFILKDERRRIVCMKRQYCVGAKRRYIGILSPVSLFQISLIYGPLEFFKVVLKYSYSFVLNCKFTPLFTRRNEICPIHFALGEKKIEEAILLIRNQKMSVNMENHIDCFYGEEIEEKYGTDVSLLHFSLRWEKVLFELTKRKDLELKNLGCLEVMDPKRLTLGQVNPLHYMIAKKIGNIKTAKILLKRFPCLLNSYSYIRDQGVKLHTIHIAAIFGNTYYLKFFVGLAGKSILNETVKNLGGSKGTFFRHKICEGDSILHLMVKFGRSNRMINKCIKMGVNTRIKNLMNLRSDELYTGRLKRKKKWSRTTTKQNFGDLGINIDSVRGQSRVLKTNNENTSTRKKLMKKRNAPDMTFSTDPWKARRSPIMVRRMKNNRIKMKKEREEEKKREMDRVSRRLERVRERIEKSRNTGVTATTMNIGRKTKGSRKARRKGNGGKKRKNRSQREKHVKHYE